MENTEWQGVAILAIFIILVVAHQFGHKGK